MTWAELERALKKKLTLKVVQGGKHEEWDVLSDGESIATYIASRGSGEMPNRAFGNVARDLQISEAKFKKFIACEVSGDELCEAIKKKAAGP